VLSNAAAAAAPKVAEVDVDGEDCSPWPFSEPLLSAPRLSAAGVNTLRLSATRVKTLRPSAAGRAGIAVSARVVAGPASTPLALALPAAGLMVGLVLPTSSAGKGTSSRTVGEAGDDAEEYELPE